MFLLLIFVGGCDGLPTETDLTGNLVERLERNREFETLSDLIGDTGLNGLLTSGEPYTLLAPTETGFEYLGSSFLSSLLREEGITARVVRHHVIQGRLGDEDLTDGAILTTIDGRTLTVERVGPVVRVDGVRLDLTEAIEAEGSVAYPIADVLLGALTIRERVTLAPSLSSFLALANRVGLLNRADALESVTLLAPIDDAFTALGPVRGRLFGLTSTVDVEERVLNAHLVSGTPALTDGASVPSIEGDLVRVSDQNAVRTIGGRRILREERLSDGRLLVLDGVVLETITLAQRMRIEPSLLLYWQELRDKVPALWARLQDEDDALTMFAPTAIAYQLRGAPINNALTESIHASLNRRVLSVQLVEGAYTEDELVEGAELPTLEGSTVSVSRDGATILLDGRRLGTRVQGLRATNGVLYPVNAFFTPPVDPLDSALLRGFTEHVSAVFRSDLVSIFRAPGTSAFLGTDSLYIQTPSLRSNPAPYLLFNATQSLIPTLGEREFTALDGSSRSITVVECADGTDPEIPLDRFCSPYQLDTGTQVYQGNASFDGASYLHVLRSLSSPPDA